MAIGETSPTILLLGGGYTLQRVAERLPSGSFVITSRNIEKCNIWKQQGWHACPAAVDERESVERVFGQFPELSVVVDSVPPLRSWRGEENQGEIQATGGVENVLRALRNTKVERVVYLSTTGVFGVRDGSWVEESTPAMPWNPQGAARLACEELYRQGTVAMKGASRRLTSVSLRLPAIYGSDRGLLHSLRSGTYTLVGDGSQWTNRIHVNDLADIIVRCIEYKGVLPSVLCVNDDYPSQARDVVSYVCTREGLPLPPSVSPDEVLKRGAYTMLSNQRVRNVMMKSVLNVSLRYPSYREGIEG